MQAQQLYPNLSPKNTGSINSPVKESNSRLAQTRNNSVDLQSSKILNQYQYTKTVDGRQIEFFIHINQEALEKKRLKQA